MIKYVWVLFFGFLFIPQPTLAFDFGSDTSTGSQTFSEALSFDGYFGRRGTWSVDYTYSRQQSPNSAGIQVIDNTTELDLAFGAKQKKFSEWAIGLTFANTPDENLKDTGPNFYFGQTFPLTERSEKDFYPTLAYKLTLSDLNYVQTFSTTALTRTGKVKPVTGSSSINQVFPELQLTWEPSDSFTFKGAYTRYFYNRNVNDFLTTLDSPRAVAVGIFGLTNAVSSFNTDMWELDVEWTPLDSWEFDEEATAATSAADGTTAWTFKEAALYNISKSWVLGLAYEYEQSDILTENIYTLTIKYSDD